MAAGTDDFAGLLSALKERSGRSYGALARQLHMSTSTLHRYCNGDAVPTEYAPVERLARLCGATPDELVELHRQWILADDARRRGRAGAAESPGEPSSESSGEPEPTGEAEPGVPPVPAPGAGAPEREPEDEAPESLVVGPEPTSRKRRLRIAVATAAVVAVAVPAAVAVSQFGGEADGTGQPRAGAGADATTGTSASPSASASTSASPSGSASPGGKKASASPSDPAATKKSEAPAEQSGGAAPSVGISSYNWEEPCGEEYLLDQRPGQVPPPPAPQDTRNWARALGGVSAGDTKLQLTVTGNTDDAVVITDLNVRVVGRKAPLPWQAYSMGDGCGSGVTPQTFDIDLDNARPLVKPVAGQDGDTVVPAKDFPYKVSTHDPQVLNLDVHTEGHEATWYLELAWSSGDRKGTVRVDDDGKPFRTSAFDEGKLYHHWPEKGEWIAQ
ncbi:helix-turn-helix domain-containing protein [Streptomyces sp. NPDC059909]|uniref:helix-turn-helix domain-containing protein n=1 Tax=Streptomyces sp. NPDC059909 TaxID=3346998 RepID=UPI003653A3D2